MDTSAGVSVTTGVGPLWVAAMYRRTSLVRHFGDLWDCRGHLHIVEDRAEKVREDICLTLT